MPKKITVDDTFALDDDQAKNILDELAHNREDMAQVREMLADLMHAGKLTPGGKNTPAAHGPSAMELVHLIDQTRAAAKQETADLIERILTIQNQATNQSTAALEKLLGAVSKIIDRLDDLDERLDDIEDDEPGDDLAGLGDIVNQFLTQQKNAQAQAQAQAQQRAHYPRPAPVVNFPPRANGTTNDFSSEVTDHAFDYPESPLIPDQDGGPED